MANRFEKGSWPDREVQYQARRRLVDTSETDVFDIEKVEGEVTEAGKAFNQENMEGLENRIYNAFDILESSDIKMTDASNIFTATTVDGAMTELFQYAGNGKTAIATAIGSEVNTTDNFTTLASAITNGKLAIATALGDSSWQTTTFGWLAYMADFYRDEALKKRNVSFHEVSIASGNASTGNISQNISVSFSFLPTIVFALGVRISFPDLDTTLQTSYGNYPTFTLYPLTNLTQSGFTITNIANVSKRFSGGTALIVAIE